MPNKCDYCSTPIDPKKGHLDRTAHAREAGRERTRGLLLEAPLSGEVTRQGPSVLRTARIHPLIEHAGAGTDCVFVTPMPATRHTGGAPQRQCLAHLWPAVPKWFLAR
jgi:hypothetical protein